MLQSRSQTAKFRRLSMSRTARCLAVLSTGSFTAKQRVSPLLLLVRQPLTPPAPVVVQPREAWADVPDQEAKQYSNKPVIDQVGLYKELEALQNNQPVSSEPSAGRKGWHQRVSVSW